MLVLVDVPSLDVVAQPLVLALGLKELVHQLPAWELLILLKLGSIEAEIWVYRHALDDLLDVVKVQSF